RPDIHTRRQLLPREREHHAPADRRRRNAHGLWRFAHEPALGARAMIAIRSRNEVRRTATPRRAPRPRPAFTMVEVAASCLIVGVMIGAAIDLVGSARTGQVWNSEKLRALALAQAMMSEVTDSYYQDPAAAIVLFGPEIGEDQTVRTTLNDVD